MSFFQKSKIELEKTLHHHFFGVRLRHFRDLTFMLLFLFGDVVTCRPLCCGFANRRKNTKKVANVGKAVCANSWMAVFGGCFGKCPNRFGEMEQNSLPQTDGRESWEVVLGNS